MPEDIKKKLDELAKITAKVIKPQSKEIKTEKEEKK